MSEGCVASLKAFTCFVETGIPILSRVFVDFEEKLAFLVSQLFSCLVVSQLRGSVRKHFPGLLAARVVLQLCYHAKEQLRVWRKDLFDSINDPQYFVLPYSLLTIQVAIVSTIIAYEPDRLVEFSCSPTVTLPFR